MENKYNKLIKDLYGYEGKRFIFIKLKDIYIKKSNTFKYIISYMYK